MAHDHGLRVEGLDLVDGVDPFLSERRGEGFGEVGVGAVIDDVARDGQFQIGHPQEGTVIGVGVAHGDCEQLMAFEVDGQIMRGQRRCRQRRREVDLVPRKPRRPERLIFR